MKFSIKKNYFIEALSKTQGVVDRKSTMPILSNILIEAKKKDKEITVQATDLEIGVEGKYEAEVVEDGKMTVSARKLFDLVREMPQDDVYLSKEEGHQVEITCGKAIFKILGLAPEDFPPLPDISKVDFFMIDGAVLKEMFEKTSFSISTDETRHALNGILFQRIIEDDRSIIRMVATDGHRLSLCDREVDTDVPEIVDNIIVPRKGIHEVRRLLEDGEGSISIGLKDQNIIFKKGSFTIIARLIDGDFPNYDNVIPKGNEKIVLVDRLSIHSSVKRVSILTTERSKGVKFGVTSGKMEISLNNPELGEAYDEIEIDYNDEALEIGFNVRYLIDVLGVIDTEKIKIALNDELSAGLVTPDGDDGFRYVLMPIRL
ncbi:DNA polymerase III subunit beta [Thermodesulfobacteriota bacterium]